MQSSSNRTSLYVPSVYVVPEPPPPSPPPFPGTVTPEMVQAELGRIPEKETPFLVPWKNVFDIERVNKERGCGTTLLPSMVDTKVLHKAHERFDVAVTLAAVFKDHPQRDAMIKAVLLSMENPFCANSSPIVWHMESKVHLMPSMDAKHGGKKLVMKHRTLLEGTPWTIRCFGLPGVGPRKNMIYGESGDCIAQVDFGHNSVGIHAHALVKNNLDHTPSEDPEHLFRLRHCPWAWTCVPHLTAEMCQQLLAKKLGGEAVDSGDDEVADGVAEMMSLATPLPDTRALDEMRGWALLSVPRENYMGSDSSG